MINSTPLFNRLCRGVLVFLFTLFSAGSVATAAEIPKKLKLAYAGWEIGTAVAYVGVDGGLFKQYGVEIEELPIRDTFSAGVQSLLGVDLLIGYGSPLAVVQPIAGGADLALIGAHASFVHYSMGVGSDIDGVKELKGKKVGVSRLGGRSDLVARVILRRAGLDPSKDVEMVAAGRSPARAVALSKNLVQGAPFRQDLAAQAKQLGIKFLDVKAVPIVTDMLITTRSFIRRDEDVLRRFMKGYAAAIQFFVSKRSESLAILRKYFPDTQEVSVDVMYDAFSAQLRPLPEMNSEALQALIDVTTTVEPRAHKLKPSDIIEARFFEELKGSEFLKELYTEKVSL